MQTRLDPEFAATPRGQEAAALIRSCVHCGFCTATCPTYQLLGDELDGPRGRISLMQQMLEGEVPTSSTRLHLDRCLTCRACESTCPSGVQYGKLLDIGRQIVEEKAPRSWAQRTGRRLMADILTGRLFAPLLRAARAVRPLLPRRLQSRIPRRSPAGAWPMRLQSRRVLLLQGCVQPALSPDINAATARILDRLGIEVVVAAGAGCCGAIRHHLTITDDALADMRRNVDAWWPHVEAGVEAIVSNASGCGVMLREYGHQLRDDPLYSAKAERVARLVRDPVELLEAHSVALQTRMRRLPQRVAFQSPCTLQHGSGLRGAVETLLKDLGVELVGMADAGSCCGSAGTYSILQPEISRQLGEAKAAALGAQAPEVILSANIGCIVQLDPLCAVPVKHWLEWLDAQMDPHVDAPLRGAGVELPATDAHPDGSGSA